MRTIKFLAFAVALAAAVVPLKAQQTQLRPGAFPAIDRMARMQVHRVERWKQMQHVRKFRAMRTGRFALAGKFAKGRGMKAAMGRGAGWRGMGPAGARVRGMHAARFGGRAGFQAGQAGLRAGRGAGFQAGLRAGRGAGFQSGLKAGRGAGFRAGLKANATPEQKALTEQFAKQRQDVRQQVQAGKLTREQARAEMKKWRTEHLPKK